MDELKTILLVEDETLIAMAEKMTLEKAGYRVITASKGRKAIDIISGANGDDIDLILMDIDLGSGMDGTEAAQIILETRRIPLVFLSSHTEPGVVKKTEGITSYGYIVKNSGDTVLLASIKMAFRLAQANRELQLQKEHLREALVHQERAEDELRINEERFQKTLEAIPDMISIHDRDFNIIYSNWRGLAGIPTEDRRRGGTCFKLYRDFDDICPDCRAKEVFATKKPVEEEVHMPDGSWAELRVLPLYDRDREINLFVEWVRDISDKKEMELELRRSEKKWKSYIRNAPYAVFITDEKGRYLETNPAASEITGYSEEELQEMSIADLLPPEAQKAGKRHFKTLLESGTADGETPFVRKDGEPGWWRVNARKLSEDRFISFASDTTDMRKSSGALEQQLIEKALLLRESHHRIKNNIGSIKSLLRLQLSKVSGDEAKEVLREAVGRVGSMHHLYERMLVTDTSGKADIADFLSDLAASVETLFNSDKKIRIERSLDSAEVDAKQLFPLGIMVNELLTNSMKYAFPEEWGGLEPPQILLTARIHTGADQSSLHISVEDNGVGLPEGFDPDAGTGFGFQLLTMLSRQIGAELSIGSRWPEHTGDVKPSEYPEKGARVSILLPLNP
jgi:two-component system, sensor histidine kinase PdtaS